ncbi:HAD ATPase, P-type, family IC, partial [Pseudoloma neurophilia]
MAQKEATLVIHGKTELLFPLYYVLCVLTLGILPLLVRFFPAIRQNLFYKDSSFKTSTHLLLKETREKKSFLNLILENNNDQIVEVKFIKLDKKLIQKVIKETELTLFSRNNRNRRSGSSEKQSKFFNGRSFFSQNHMVNEHNLSQNNQTNPDNLDTKHYDPVLFETLSDFQFLLENGTLKYVEISYTRFFYWPERGVFSRVKEIAKEIERNREIREIIEDFESSTTSESELTAQYNASTVFIQKNQSEKEVNEQIENILKRQFNPLTNYILFGLNNIKLPVKTIFQIICMNVFSNFSIYIFLTIFIWIEIDYSSYAILLLIINGYSIINDIITEIRSRNNIENISADTDETDNFVHVLRPIIEPSKETIHKTADFSTGTLQSNDEHPSVFLINNTFYQFVNTKNTFLFPNDVVIIKPGPLTADLHLLNCGCLVNEAFLTGECVPVERTNEMTRAGTDIKQVIYNKNEPESSDQKPENLNLKSLSQSNIGNLGDSLTALPLARVHHTGFDTTKGHLIRSLLISPDRSSTFITSATKIILYCFLLGILTAVVSFFYLYYLYKQCYSFSTLFYYIIDLIITIISPALPATISIGISISCHRLLQYSVKCNKQNRIIEISNIDTIIFDKTGTLTEEGLDLQDVFTFFVSKNDKISSLEGTSQTTSIQSHKFEGQPHEFDQNDRSSDEFHTCNEETITVYDSFETLPSPIESDASLKMKTTRNVTIHDKSPDINEYLLNLAMSTCHSIKLIDGQLQGDPLEIKMFEKSENSEFIDNKTTRVNEMTYKKVKEMPFDSNRRRQSVIVSKKSESWMFSKGSPESIFSILSSYEQSKYKNVYEKKNKEFTLNGLRTIAICYKEITLPNDKNGLNVTDQNDIEEKDMKLLALLIFENSLKPDTPLVIHHLSNLQFKMTIATGDNLLTAISIARRTGMTNLPIVIPYYNNNQENQFVLDDEEIPFEWYCIPPDGHSLKHEPDYSFDPIRKKCFYGKEETAYNIAIEGKEFSLLFNNERKNTAFQRNPLSNGSSFNEEPSDSLESLVLEKCVVYGRMSPDDKKLLVSLIPSLFVGDGANDVGALQESKIGLAINANNCTLNSSFISTTDTLLTVCKLIEEGRNSLIISFNTFFFTLYGSLLQFLSLTIMTLKCLFVSEIGTMHFDMAIVLIFALFLSSAQKKSSGNKTDDPMYT